MTKKPKNAVAKLAHNVPLGPERHEKIRRFCARIESAGGKRPTIPDAVNLLVDKGLELEQV